MIDELLKKYAKCLWLVPALLMWSVFPPLMEKANVLFALAPLMWLTRHPGERGARGAAFIWWLNGFAYYLATLSWMPAIVKNGGPWPLVALGLVALSGYCSLYFAAYGYLATKIWAWTKGRSYWWRIFMVLLAEPVLWAGLEIVRSRFGGGFAWNQLGVAAVNAGFGEPAVLGGVYILSMIIVMVNGSIAGIAERVFRKGGTALETLLPLALIYGIYQLAAANIKMPDGEPLKVALVQRNFPCVFSAKQEEDPEAAYSNLLANVEYLKPDLVVLPESAMAEFGRIDGPSAEVFAASVRQQTGAELVLAGGNRAIKDQDGTLKLYNSAAIYGEETFAVYDKVHLVPFGEFIPGDKWIPWLQKWAPVGSCTPGELKLLGDFGVAICYEDTDSAQMRRLAEMGAKALVFVTNDSWFGRSEETVQHAWQAVARAIETGLPIVRVGNSGVSGTVSPDGKATWMTDAKGRVITDRRGTMFDRIILAQNEVGGHKTWYVRLGDKPIFIAFLLLITASIMVKYKIYLKDIPRRRNYGTDK